MSVFISKIRIFFASDIGIALIIAIGWKVLITIIGYAIDSHSSSSAIGLFDHTVRWDSNWYLAIINGHYSDIRASAAFYPLFPLLVYTVHLISFGNIDYLISAQIVNTLSVWLALFAAIKISKLLIGEKQRFWIVALLLSAPAAFFMHAFYSEALFVALGFFAYYCALTKKWLAVGILLGILSATRLPSVLIIGLCGLEFLRSYNWDVKRALNKKAFYFCIAPIGFILFSIYLNFAQNDFLGMFHAYKETQDWNYQVFNINIFQTMAKVAYQIIRALFGVRPFDSDFIVNILLPAISLLGLVLSSLYLILRHKQKLLPLGIIGILSIVMFTINSNVVSVHRYILPSLTIYIAASLFLSRHLKTFALIIICCISVTAQIYLYTLFIDHLFAG